MASGERKVEEGKGQESAGPSLLGPLSVVHLVDAAGGSEQLWGKERVVLWLAQSQIATGQVRPRIWTLTPKLLTQTAEKDGIESASLSTKVSKNLHLYARHLRERLSAIEPSIVHSHGYKANLVSRLARRIGAPMVGLVSTCHGWVNTSISLRVYNALDRWTSRWSDAVTVPSEVMLARLPRSAVAIPNGIPDAPPASAERRTALRRLFGFQDTQIVAGVVGRLSPEKGIHELIAAAELTKNDERLVWCVAGTGPMEAALRSAREGLPNLRFVGYVDGSHAFLPAIDVFVQPSRSEGLSLSLLEACRGGLAIVATRVGATEWAVRNDREAVLISPGAADCLAEAVKRVSDDPLLRARLGREARRRFVDALDIAVMQKRYLDLYRRVAKGTS